MVWWDLFNICGRHQLTLLAADTATNRQKNKYGNKKHGYGGYNVLAFDVE